MIKVKSIRVIFEEDDQEIVAFYSQGMWTVSAPLYSRFFAALHEVWQVLRDAVKQGEAGPGKKHREQLRTETGAVKLCGVCGTQPVAHPDSLRCADCISNRRYHKKA